MAVAPLFVTDMDTLKARLRLDSARLADALAVMDQAVLDVRLGFYDRLGKSRIDTIKDTAEVEDPETDAELLRSLATSIEVLWVRRKLLPTIPQFFVDGAAARLQAWNEEGAFAARNQTERDLARLDAQIEDGLVKLAGDLDEEDEPNVFLSEPEEEQDLPGASVFPALRRNPAWDDVSE